MIDLTTAVVHGSPSDIADWPVTTTISAIDMAPGKSGGLSFVFAPGIPASWDYHMPGWGDLASGDPGNVLFTVWAGALIQNVWHIAGFLQMWTGKERTGASLPSNWADWAYAADRWGPELVSYKPQAGDKMLFFVSAGNARDAKGVTSVRERSNAVVIDLFSNETSHSDFMPNVGTSPPIVGIPPPAAPTDLSEILIALAQVNTQIAALLNKPPIKYVGSLFGAKITLTPLS